MNRSCNAPASADSLGYRVGHIARVALLLMGFSLMCILMVNGPGSRAMAAAPDGSESQQESSVERIAARSTQEPGDTTVKPRRRSAGVQVASLGPDKQPSLSDAPSVGGGAVRWVASSGCLNAKLRRIVGEVAAAYGPVTVNSTCRSRRATPRWAARATLITSAVAPLISAPTAMRGRCTPISAPIARSVA